jgi:hypothetical protein
MCMTIFCYVLGEDAPFCGTQSYFKPCATIKYAMSLIEGIGPWVEFVVGQGDYWIQTPIKIDYVGIIIRADAFADVIFRCYQCVIINAPSFQVMNIEFANSETAITINSGQSNLSQIAILPSIST